MPVLDCDLAEGEPASVMEAFMSMIDAANIACGTHAGDPDSMRRAVDLAVRHGVLVGAHPGLPGDWRDQPPPPAPDPERFVDLLNDQLGQLAEIARAQGASLHHVKLHGRLYHLSESDLAEPYLEAITSRWRHLVIVARAGGRLARLAPRHGVQVWEEAFLDRTYRDDGSLVPRGQPGALLQDPHEVRERIRSLLHDGTLRAVSGRPLRLRPRVLCVHSDTPGALGLLAAARELLDAHEAGHQRPASE